MNRNTTKERIAQQERKVAKMQTAQKELINQAKVLVSKQKELAVDMTAAKEMLQHLQDKHKGEAVSEALGAEAGTLVLPPGMAALHNQLHPQLLELAKSQGNAELQTLLQSFHTAKDLAAPAVEVKGTPAAATGTGYLAGAPGLQPVACLPGQPPSAVMAPFGAKGAKRDSSSLKDPETLESSDEDEASDSQVQQALFRLAEEPEK